ncbi:MAG: DUF4062 domain-containing protein, partial [bacterium]|nr:DUF4062 domain-containing protein [bacterium]
MAAVLALALCVVSLRSPDPFGYAGLAWLVAVGWQTVGVGFRAFVSSTFVDLQGHRGVVVSALRRAGFDVDPMEDWTAASDEPMVFSQARVEGCDLCVLLVGLRRGHVPDGSELSITQLEYQSALDAGVDVLVFMLGEDEPWSRPFDELDSDPGVRVWRGELMESHGVGWFSTAPESVDIAPALSRWLVERRRLGSEEPDSGDRMVPLGLTNLRSRGRRPFVGREVAIGELDGLLGDVGVDRVVLVHGPPGVGKSELAQEYGRLHRDRYRGGRFFIDFSGGGGPVDIARLGANQLGLGFGDGLGVADQCERTLVALWGQPTLLVYDNPPTVDEIEPWLPPQGTPCHVLVTSTNSQLLTPATPAVRLDPLDDETARQLIAEAATVAIAQSTAGDRLVVRAGGLPVHLLPASDAMAYALGRGRSLDEIGQELGDDTTSSFGLAYESLDRSAQLALHAMALLATDRVERQELESILKGAFGWSRPGLNVALDVCADRHLITGVDQLRMHQLLAAYVTTVADSGLAPTETEVLKVAVWDGLVAAAEAVVDAPGDHLVSARFLSYQSEFDNWADLVDYEPLSTIGRALVELGRFDEARPWYERAVTEKEQGDIHGRIDHASLGTSLHLIGFCYSSVGQYDEARPWYERAV